MLKPIRRIKNKFGDIIYISGDLKTIMLYLLSYCFDIAVNKTKQYKISSKRHYDNKGQEYLDITIETEQTTELFDNIPTSWGRIDISIINQFIENKGE